MSDITGEDMQCPGCSTNLKPMDEKRYETLSEHVSNPNGTPTYKTGYGCPNKLCYYGLNNVRWLYDGEGPYSPPGVRLEPPFPVPYGTLWAKIRRKYPEIET